MTTLLQDGMVATPERLTAEIARQVAEAGVGGGGGSTSAIVTPPRRFLATNRPQGGYSWWTADTSAAQTFGEIRTLLGASGWVRIGFNYDLTAALGGCSVSLAKVAQSSTYAVPFAPVDRYGAAASWTTLTFNNGGLDITLQEQLAAEIDSGDSPVTTIALNHPPVNATAWAGTPNHRKQPGVTWSDWMHVPPHRRTDGGAFNLLMTLVKFSGAVAISRALGDAYDVGAAGRFVHSFSQAGDAVTDPTTFTATTRGVDAIWMTVQYVPQFPVTQVITTGDSTENPVLQHVSMSVYDLSTTEHPIEFCNTAAGGLSTAEYAQKLRPILRASQSSVAFLRMWSPNAGASLSLSERGWAEMMQIADEVKKSGGTPVLMTPYPNPGRITTLAQEQIRLEMVRRCRDAADTGVRVLDLDALMSDGATPVAGFLPGYSDDGTHPTQTGQVLMKDLATKPLLADILGL